MNETMTFYDPHPGELGCAKPFPEHLRITAQWLDGQTMTVDEAIQCFKDAAPEHEQPITVTAEQNCILIQMGSYEDWKKGVLKHPAHCWRAIRFRTYGSVANAY